MVVLVITLVTLIPVAVLLESCHIGSLTWAWWLKHVETTAAEQVHLPAMRPKGFFKPRMVLWLVSREYFQGWRELFSVLSTASTPLCVSQAMRRQRAEAVERQNRLGDRLDQMQMHRWMPETAASLERHASAKRNSVEVGVNKKLRKAPVVKIKHIIYRYTTSNHGLIGLQMSCINQCRGTSNDLTQKSISPSSFEFSNLVIIVVGYLALQENSMPLSGGWWYACSGISFLPPCKLVHSHIKLFLAVGLRKRNSRRTMAWP